APRDDEAVLPTSALAAGMAARDYQEAICYAFVDPRLLQTWQLDANAVLLANPLSNDLAVMRTSLLPGLVEALKRNRNRQQARVRLFESGVVFAKQGESAPVETTMLAAVACGNAHAEQWGEPKRTLDFFDIKGDLESLIDLSGAPEAWSFDATDLPTWLHPGRSARVLRDGVPVGMIGALHPALQRQLDVPEAYALEIELQALRRRTVPVARALPHFPSLRRDIAIEVDEAVEWARIASALRSGLPKILNELVLFDCFRGPGLSADRKSLAIGLILQGGSRTLTDEDADQSVADAVSLLEREFGARLRG
ncbi:MAG TPA: phenylalanine--tRNA ligase subunit beta, partial [Rhodanobacteraceae bacterium]